MDELSHALTNKLLHAPTHALNRTRDEDDRERCSRTARAALPDATKPNEGQHRSEARAAERPARGDQPSARPGKRHRGPDNYRKLTREHAEIDAGSRALPAVRERRARHGSGAGDGERSLDARVRRNRDPRDRASGSPAREPSCSSSCCRSDPNDERNIFLEIRAGTGGDESALFAGDLFRMYSRYAERNGWQVEVMSQSPAELGGYKEIIARIIGRGRLFEAQVRVRRRIACSACRSPRRRAASTLPPAPSRSCPRPTRSRMSC